MCFHSHQWGMLLSRITTVQIFHRIPKRYMKHTADSGWALYSLVFRFDCNSRLIALQQKKVKCYKAVNLWQHSVKVMVRCYMLSESTKELVKSLLAFCPLFLILLTTGGSKIKVFLGVEGDDHLLLTFLFMSQCLFVIPPSLSCVGSKHNQINCYNKCNY